MPLSNELRQRLVLVLQKEGEQSIDQVRSLMRDLQGEFVKAGEALSDAFVRGEGSIVEFSKATVEITREYNELSKLIGQVEAAERAAAEAAGEALRKRIDGYARADAEAQRYLATLKAMQDADMASRENEAAEQNLRDMAELQEKLRSLEERSATERAANERLATAALEEGNQAVRARMALIQSQIEAEGEAKRARIEAIALAERRAEEADAAQKQRDGDALRARIEAYARDERMAEDANRAAKQKLGDALRASIDAHVRREQAAEEEHKRNMARMDAEAKASESLNNQKALYQRLNSGTLNDEQAKSLERLTASLKDGAKFSDEFVQKFNGIAGGMNKAEERSKTLAMGLMAVAHAGQDAQYGFGAVLNNIPQITYAFTSAIPSLEKYAMSISAIAMIGGTLVNIAMPQIKSFATNAATELGLIADPTRVLVATTSNLKAQLDALNAKSYKVDLDYHRIDAAEKKMKELESSLKTWDSIAESRTSIEEESGKRFKDMIVEGGGGEAMQRAATDALSKQGMLNLDTETSRKLKSNQAELESVIRQMQRPMSSPQEAIGLANRRASLEASLPELRDKVRDEIQEQVESLLGKAGEGDKNALRDIMGAFAFSPESFAAAGMDMRKLGIGLMAAQPENVKDERESNKEAERQAARVKAEKQARADQTEALNTQGQEAEAEMRRQMQAKEDQRRMLNEQAKAAQAETDRVVKERQDAAKAAEKQRKDAARALADRLNREGKFDDERAKEEANALKAMRAEDFAQRFRQAGFADNFAQHGAELAANQMKQGRTAEAALEAVYRLLLKKAATDEQMMGVMGQASQLIAQLEQRDRMLQAQLQQAQGNLNRGRNRRPNLLRAPGQR